MTTTGVPSLGERVMLRRPVFSGAGLGLAQVAAGQHLAQDDPHLELGEGGADAAADAAAEGDPGVGVRAVLEEALGAEGEGLGVEVGAGVGEPDRRR